MGREFHCGIYGEGGNAVGPKRRIPRTKRESLGSAKVGEHAATQHNNILFFSRISSHLLSNGLPVFLNCPIFYFF